MERMKKQHEIIKKLNEQQILNNLLVTQFLLLAITIVLALILFPSITEMTVLFQWDLKEILLYGGGASFLVLTVDYLLMKKLPEHHFDDGGINEKLFRSRTTVEIILLCMLIATTEELLFRGVLQSKFGLIMASVIFAILHIRYLFKWVLFFMVIAVSFLLGIVYEVTENLWVVIFSHFLIDFIFALTIRHQYLKKVQLSQGETFDYDDEEFKS